MPGPAVPALPVWYDADGLRRGEVTLRTPVELLLDDHRGALALVHDGAVYRNPVSDEIWFHPWDRKPRVVGEGSREGPAGDAYGSTAAWFDGVRVDQRPVLAGEQHPGVLPGLAPRQPLFQLAGPP